MKTSLSVLVYSFLLLISFHPEIYAQLTTENESLKKKVYQDLKEYDKLNFHEKIYIHFDKPYYAVGEDIWFSVYLVNANNHKQQVPSNIVYVELISPENKIIATKVIKVAEGGGQGDFEISRKFQEGQYLVRAYTNYMRNYSPDFFFKKKLKVWNYRKYSNLGKEETQDGEVKEVSIGELQKNNIDLDIQFFPEGGDLVENIPSVVAFKSFNQIGESVGIEGGVYDQDNTMVTFIKSTKFGIGTFNFMPTKGNTYHLKVKYSDKEFKWELPKAKPLGYVMRVDNTAEDYIKITLTSNIPQGIQKATVIGHVRGNIVLAYDNLPDKNKIQFKVDKTKLQDGIMHLTLFDHLQRPHCERLIFIHNKGNEVISKISPDREEYDVRKPVNLTLKLNEELGNTLNGNFSVSVTNSDLLSYDPNADNIKSYLLLNSDLQGEIENPNYYFKNTDRQKKMELDQLLLSQGWRRFKWSDILDRKETVIKYFPEKGFNISGHISDYYDKDKVIKGKIKLTSTKDYINFNEVETGEDGRFIFMGFDFEDSTDMILQAQKEIKKKKKTKIKNSVAIEIDQFKNHPFNAKKIYNSYKESKKEVIKQDYVKELDKIEEIDGIYNFGEKTIVLDELTISETKSKQDDPFFEPNRTYTSPDHRVVMDSIPGVFNAISVVELLRSQVPGITISGSFPNYRVIIRGVTTINGNTSPVVTINGMPAEINDLLILSPMDIRYIDVVKSPTSLGVRGAAGLIAVYLKKEITSGRYEENKGILTFKSPSYYAAREFYSPKYNIKDPKHVKPDHRITLYWNPNVSIDENGKAKVSFFTSDKSANYKICVEGLTQDGRPFVTENYFLVEKNN